MSKVTILTSRYRAPGWKHWEGCIIRDYTPKNASFDDVLIALAEFVRKVKQPIAVVNNTDTNHRIIGWDYQYPTDTLEPSLNLFYVEGESLAHAPTLDDSPLERMIKALRYGLSPEKAIVMTPLELLWFNILEECKRFSPELLETMTKARDTALKRQNPLSSLK